MADESCRKSKHYLKHETLVHLVNLKNNVAFVYNTVVECKCNVYLIKKSTQRTYREHFAYKYGYQGSASNCRQYCVLI